MNKWKLMLLASASLTANLALADESDTDASEHRAPVTKGAVYQPVKEMDPGYFEIILMGGPASLNGGDVDVAITPYETDRLVQTNSNSWSSGTGQAGIGYSFVIPHDMKSGPVTWIPEISPQLNVYYLSGDMDGDVYRFTSPAWNQETYEFDVKSTRLMLDLRVAFAAINDLSIYGIAGFGVAWNQLEFDAVANSGLDCPITPMSLESANSTTFAYEFGGGLNFQFIDNVGISLEYLYARLNDVSVGTAIPAVNNAESQSMDIASQAVFLGLTIGL